MYFHWILLILSVFVLIGDVVSLVKYIKTKKAPGFGEVVTLYLTSILVFIFLSIYYIGQIYG
jgi:hypothetical protein